MNNLKDTIPENLTILFHLRNHAIESLEDLYREQQNDFTLILEIFLNKIKKISSHFYFTHEKESPIIKIILESALNKKIKTTTLAHNHEIEILKQVYQNNKLQSITYFDQVQPLLDLQVLNSLIQIHTKYQADYTYSENIPEGLAPVIYGPSIVQTLELFSIKFPKNISNILSLQHIITKNIDQFHTEIYYDHTQDLRMLRLDFSLNSSRSQKELLLLIYKIQNELDSKVLDAPYLLLSNSLKETPQILTSFPSYLEIEIISSCSYACTFCPRQYLDIPNHQLTLESLQKISEYIKITKQDTSVCLGGLGEPTEHPQCLEILQLLLDQEEIQNVVLETNGYYLESLLPIIKHPKFFKLKIILNINSIQKYQEIHGYPGFQRVQENLDLFLEQIKQTHIEQTDLYQKNLILQTLKLKENQTELESLYTFAKKRNITFLLQKYNSYIGLMPEKRVSNMTPLERSPCWHLRRDLFIRADGNVSFCKQDIKNPSVRGNIHNDDIKDIWKNQVQSFKENINNQLSKKPNCSQCDEYFTFNL